MSPTPRRSGASPFAVAATLFLALGAVAAPPRLPFNAPIPSPGGPVSRAHRDAYTAMFEQWRTLPLPDVVGRQRVEVKVKGLEGADNATRDGVGWPLANRGFLLREDTSTFTVFLDCAKTVTFFRRPTVADNVPYGSAAWEKIDLSKEIRHLLSLPAGMQPGRNPLLSSRLTVYYGYLAHRLRLPELDALLSRLESPELRAPDEPKDTVQLWRQRRATYLLWSAGSDLRFREPWSTAQAQCRLVAEHFPGTPAATQARDLIDQLALAARDELNPPAAATRIERAIAGLRQQTSSLFLTPPGQPSPFQAGSPAAQLVDEDLHAVPALIGILEDARITRSVSLDLRGLYVGRYGDFALRILERISARTFLARDGQEHANTTPAVLAARAWWEDVRRRGERAVLSEGVLHGPDRLPQAERLVRRYPLDALPVLRDALDAASDSAERSLLVFQLADLPDSTDLLYHLLDVPDPHTRVAAARLLYDRGDDAGLEPTLALIRELVSTVRTEAQVGLRIEPEPESAQELPTLVEFMANAREGWALTATWRSLSHGPAFLKGVFLSSLENPEGSADEALGLALDDQTVLPVGYLQVQGVDVPAPRVCDMAAAFLARRLPHTREPEPLLSIARRDREVERIRAAWLKDQGLPPLPGGTALPAAAPEAEALCRDLRTPARAGAARARLTALGARAVPALRHAAQSGGASVVLPVLREIVAKVEHVVVEGVPADHPAARAARAWQGKSLDFNAIADLLQTAGKGTWPTIDGWDLLVDQPQDGSGVTVRLRFVKPEKPGKAELFDIQLLVGDGEDNPNETAIWQKNDIRKSFHESLTASRARLQDPRQDFLIVFQARRSETTPPPEETN